MYKMMVKNNSITLLVSRRKSWAYFLLLIKEVTIFIKSSTLIHIYFGVQYIHVLVIKHNLFPILLDINLF